MCLLVQVAEGYPTWVVEGKEWSQEADGLGFRIYSHGANYQGCS